YTNAAEDRMFGYGPGELTGSHVTIQSGFSEGVTRQMIAEIAAELRIGRRWEGEWVNRTKEGSPFFTISRVSKLQGSEANYWVWVREDISERRRTELDLREANERLHALIHASPLPIVAFTREGEIQLWNAAAERVFGWTEA